MSKTTANPTALQAELHALRQRVAELEAQQSLTAERGQVERLLRATEEWRADNRKTKAQLTQELATVRHELAVVQQREEHLRLAQELSLDAFTILRSVREWCCSIPLPRRSLVILPQKWWVER